MNELKIPNAAIEDENSFELLRVWAAFEEQHVSIHSGLNGNAKDFGFLLAELAYMLQSFMQSVLKPTITPC
jgi:hypothetical protein